MHIFIDGRDGKSKRGTKFGGLYGLAGEGGGKALPRYVVRLPD
jgi:hypothetical protein